MTGVAEATEQSSAKRAELRAADNPGCCLATSAIRF